MASKTTTEGSELGTQTAVSGEIAERGIRTGQDFVNLMGSLMSDLIAGRIQPNVATAVCNAGGKMLKVIEMQQKYGKPLESGLKTLQLATGE